MNERTKNLLRFVAAAVLPPIVGTALVSLSVGVFEQYGWTLFLLLPVFMGFGSAVIYSPTGNKPYWQCLLAGLSSIVVIGVTLVAVAIEGLVCLVMALPLAVAGIAIGALVGYALTRELKDNRSGVALSVLLFLAMPILMGFESANQPQPTVHQVVSTVQINAPIEVVWKNVVEFPEIDAKPEGILKLGFAYPINAKIEGHGVGAIRYCNFSTGSFVEPITTWQQPNLLAFDVKAQPAPMTELTPYDDLHARHLEYLRSQRGQFRLYEKDGETILEGTTYYTHDIAPDIYWKMFSDEIIHQIHLRVLNHIKEVSER
jgi:hypothetical protein